MPRRGARRRDRCPDSDAVTRCARTESSCDRTCSAPSAAIVGLRDGRTADGGGTVAEPGPTGTSARNSSTSMIATPDRARGAGFRTMTTGCQRSRCSRALDGVVADQLRDRVVTNRRPPGRSPLEAVLPSQRRLSSIEQPHSVSCGCAVSRSRHARSTSARRDVPATAASAAHGSASRMSARSAPALRRFSCARVAKVP